MIASFYTVWFFREEGTIDRRRQFVSWSPNAGRYTCMTIMTRAMQNLMQCF